MSWDIVAFNLNKKVHHVEEIDETILVDIGTGDDFKQMMTDSFPTIIWRDDWGKFEGADYSIEFGIDKTHAKFSNIIFHLYGSNAIYPVIELCKKYHWQIFDTALGEMIDLDNPQKNGYINHQEYVNQILHKK